MKRLERIGRCGFIGGGVSWGGWTLRFQKPTPGLVSFSLHPWNLQIRCEFSTPSPAPCLPAFCHTLHRDGNGFTLCNCTQVSSKCLILQVSLVTMFPLSNRTLTKMHRDAKSQDSRQGASRYKRRVKAMCFGKKRIILLESQQQQQKNVSKESFLLQFQRTSVYHSMVEFTAVVPDGGGSSYLGSRGSSKWLKSGPALSQNFC